MATRSLIRIVLLAVVLFASKTSSQAQAGTPFTKEHWNGHFGAVGGFNKKGDFVPIGSAFVFGPKKEIITCAHVVQSPLTNKLTNWVYATQGLPYLTLRLQKFVQKYDFAVFTTDADIPGEPMAIGDFKKIRPGDFVWYYGYDTQLSAKIKGNGAYMNHTVVAATGVLLGDKDTLFDFLEFEGHAIPGYSGGPVFNDKAELVAIMWQAWNWQGIKGGPKKLINRVFSIEPLLLSEEPDKLTGSTSNKVSMSVMPTPDVLKK